MLFEFSYWHDMQDDAFKPRAYQLAAESIGALGHEVKEAWRKGGIKELKELPAIGQAIAEKIDEYFRTGRIRSYDALKKKFPVDIYGLAHVQGLGPKHIRDLYEQLGVKNLKDLEKVLRKQQVRDLPGFGEKSEEKLARGILLMKRSTGRHLLGHILPLAEDIVTRLSRIPGVKQCVYAGSLRRRQETVGDIDLLATSSDPERVMKAFVHLPEVETVHEHGKTRSSVRLSMGIDADLRVVPDKVFGATLQYFTGDKRHNILLRERAIRQGLLLNEYGLFKGKKLLTCASEEAIYKRLGLDTPPPELRVGHDELSAAERHTLPDLLPYGSVKGDLQTQTNWSDGTSTIRDMAVAAKTYGLDYIAITDHTQSLAFINGLDEKRVAKQGKEIDTLNKQRGQSLARILKSAEVDIKPDGSLDLDDETLASLDCVGIAIHSHFSMTEKEATKRIIRAMSNPHVDCLFHPTGRLIGKREPYPLDMKAILAGAKKYRVALEINAFPDRTDLRDLHVRMAVDAGVPLFINTDAHDPEHFTLLSLGEAIARRGWATKRDIINTKSLNQLRAWLEKKRPRPNWTA